MMTFSVFVAVSLLFWLVRNFNEPVDKIYNVVFKIEHVPTDAVFTTHVPNTIKVKLYDTNSKLSSIGNSNFRQVTVDFNRYADVAGFFHISGEELKALLLNELPSTTKITSINPALIDARYAHTQGRKVPVHLSASYQTENNFKDFAPQLTPDSVLVHAPNYILDTLKYIEAELIVTQPLKDSIKSRVSMKLPLGVKTTPDSIYVVVPVSQYVNKTITKIPIEVTDLPAGKKLILFPRDIEIRCLANFNHYNQYSRDDFQLTVSYDSLQANPSRQYLPVKLQTRLSSVDIYNIQLSTTLVEFTLEE